MSKLGVNKKNQELGKQADQIEKKYKNLIRQNNLLKKENQTVLNENKILKNLIVERIKNNHQKSLDDISKLNFPVNNKTNNMGNTMSH